MLVGYVSDERYIALIDVLFEFECEGQVVAARSGASGAVYADLTPGVYQVTLAKDGFGAKIVEVDVRESSVHHFRLLSDCLLGYMWPKCVKAGEASEFRVHSPEAYKLELWRYGWEREFIQTIGWYDEHGPRATVQLSPDGDYSQTGVQWNTFGYTSPHHKQYVKAPDRSGLYYLHATGESGAFFSFPWVIAPDKPKADIAVLASDISWTAYNNFGGRSNYIHPDQLPDTPTSNARLQLNRYTNPDHINYGSDTYLPLSFDRPELVNFIGKDVNVTDPIEGRSGCHLAPAEWRLLGWMEREGFDYDYYSETQFHFEKMDLDAYRILIISTHPEYWSRSMYDRLKSWVFERGGKLLYLGGNGLNCEVDFLDEETMVVQNGNGYKMREAGTESRLAFRYESEASLLGVQFTTPGIMTSAPYQVKDADHWVFEGTGVKNGDVFGEKSLHERVPGGASGHETDKMMPESPANTHLLAQGLNPNGGGADMVVLDTESGGAVFSVGSITYVSSILVDDIISRITSNVLRDFLD